MKELYDCYHSLEHFIESLQPQHFEEINATQVQIIERLAQIKKAVDSQQQALDSECDSVVQELNQFKNLLARLHRDLADLYERLSSIKRELRIDT